MHDRSPTVNYFSHATAAGRYAQDRPYFHPLVIERMRSFLKLDAPVPLALDVGCGTGQSALALTEIAGSVLATDISPAMLAHAPEHPRIRYLQAAAEHLPLESHSVDLITVSLAFHWFDRARFLAEARRVLRLQGTLVIYSRGFRGRMKENPEFLQWHTDVYLARYPTPPRNDAPFTEQDARTAQLVFAGRERYTDEVSYSPEQLARHSLTHSNVIAAVEQGHASIEDVYAWTLESLNPYFSEPTGTFEFGGEIWYLEPLEPAG